MEGRVIDVCSFENNTHKTIYFKALEKVECTFIRKGEGNKTTLETVYNVEGYWFINQWGEKLSFHRDLKQLAQYIADIWGQYTNFKILV